MLDDREAEPRPTRSSGAVRAIETLEQPRQLCFVDTHPVVAAGDDCAAVDAPLHVEDERRAGACVADGVLREVARHDAKHPRSNRELGAVVALEAKGDTGSCSALCKLSQRLLENRANHRRPERDDAASRLELAEEEHLVDQLGDLVDLGLACSTRADASAGQHGRLQQCEQPREGVRSSCDTAAVKPERSSSYAARSPSRER